MVHELKSDNAVFQAAVRGVKNFEIRKNDRNFEVGDLLLLRETAYTGQQMAEQGMPVRYTGEMLLLKVLYILHGPAYGLAEGLCIMSTEKIKIN